MADDTAGEDVESQLAEARAAIVAARRAKRASDAILPLALRSMAELRQGALELADLMETRAREIREVAAGIDATALQEDEPDG